MTTPGSPAPRARDWWARPGVVLPLVGALVVLVALLTPQVSAGRFGDARLSSRLSTPLGARLFSDAAARFGFDTTARDRTPAPDTTAVRGATIHAVLAPPMRIAPAEAHAYLEAVRAGDALLLVLGRRDALVDSLGAGHNLSGGLLRTPAPDIAGCDGRRDFMPALWPDGRVHLYALRWPRGEPSILATFAPLDSGPRRSLEPAGEAAAGFALGQGRVVVVADPDLLRNDVLRRCSWAADLIALRMLEWLRAGGTVPRTALVFDEYHQGFGPSPSTSRVTWRFLIGHPVGRALLGLVLAGLVLLAAVGARPLAPHDREMIERRDPLEQVDALAHAYEQVGASRTVTARLLRGVRWRVEGAIPTSRHRSDDDFLTGVAATDPELRDDIALIKRALRDPAAARDLPQVGDALRRLEDTLTTTRA